MNTTFQIPTSAPLLRMNFIFSGTVNLAAFRTAALIASFLFPVHFPTVFAADPSAITVFNSLKREVYLNLPGSLVSDLTSNANFPNNPDLIGAVTSFEAPANFADNYGQKLSGYVTPATNGIYTFYISSDDQSALFLSTDDNPHNKRLICFEPDWNNARDWTAPDRRPNAENISQSLALVGGKSYYVEALMKDGGLGDNLAVAWRMADDPPPATGSAPIPGSFLSYPILDSPVLAGPIVNPATRHRYFLLKQSNWVTAEAATRKLNGHLATIRNQSEQDFVFSTFANYGGISRHLFIGLYDTDPSQNAPDPLTRRQEFAWVSGEPVTYSNWGTGEPSNLNQREFWGQIYSPSVVPGGFWNDLGYDVQGSNGSSANGVVEVLPITVSIVNPVEGSRFDEPAPISLSVSASSSDSVVAKVEYFAGSIKIGESTQSPFTVQWSPLTAGSQSITARATDGTGFSVVSDPIAIAVRIPEVLPLVLGQKSLSTLETQFSLHRWEFSAVAGQRVFFDFIGSSAPGPRFTLAGPSGWIGFANTNADSDVITLPSSGTYAIIADSTNTLPNIHYAFQLSTPDQTDLVIGAKYTGQFVGGSQAQLFRLVVTNTGPLRISLGNIGSDNRTEIAVGRSVAPTRGTFDFQSAAASGSTRELLIPNASVGTYYVLIYGDNISTPGAFDLQVTTPGVFLGRVSPDRQASNSAFTMTVTGAGFEAGTGVELVASGGTSYSASSVSVDSYTQLSANFSANAAPAGKYSVRVHQPDGDTATLTNFFEMLAPGQPKLTTRLIMPGALGRHAVATIYVEYANEGTASMPAPLLVLKSSDPDGSDRPILAMDQSRIIQNYWSATLPPGAANEAFILASGAQPGVLNPGERIQVPVYYLGLQQPWDFADSKIEMEIRYWLADDTSAIDWAARKESLRPPTLDAATWDVVYANLTADLTDTGAYIRMLNDNAQFLGRLGQHVTDVDKLWNFEVQQAYGFSPLPSLDSAVDASMPVPGLSIDISRRFSTNLRARNYSGPFGRGWYTPWQSQLVVENGGDLVKLVGEAGSARYFTRDTRNGSYFSGAGDGSSLVSISGGLFELQDPKGSITKFRADGRIDYVQDPNGNRVTASYGGSGQFTTLSHSSGATISIAYTGSGLIQSVTESSGRAVAYSYSGTYLQSVTTDDGKVTSYTYETAGSPAQRYALTSITRGGNTRHFSFDTLGRLSGSWFGSGEQSVAFGYDSAGGVTVTDAQGTTSLFYDHRGLLSKTIDPLGNITSSEFDDDLHLSRLVLPTGESQSYTWCSCGSPTSITDELGQTTRFRYEHPFKRMTSFTDARNNTTTYTFDAKGNQLATIYPNNSVERFGNFTASGLYQSYTNRRGQPISLTYNAAGQLDRQTFADGSYYRYDHDSRGNITNAVEHPVSGTDKVTAYLYNTATEGDRLRQVIYPNGRWVNFQYDAYGRRQNLTDSAGGDTRYEYDSAGRLSKLRDSSNAVLVEYLYNAAGRQERINKGNGTYAIYDCDAAGQILHLINHAPVGTVSTRFDYTYDSRGRRRTMETVDGKWTYDYDGTSQLIHAVLVSTNPSIPNQDLQYNYDSLGNRTSTVVNGVTTPYIANDLNQYSSVGGTAQQFDADGNLTSDGLRTYTYDTLNHLISVTGPEGLTEYEYNAFGNRVTTILNGQRTEYLLDPSGLVDVIAEQGGAGNLLARQVHGLGLVGRSSSTNPIRYYEFDALGSTTAITDFAGTIANRYAYNPFGELALNNESVANPLRFVGKFGVTDDNDGAHYMRARFYKASVGRFMTPDPIGLRGGDLNQLRYVVNEPTQFSDPAGLLKSLRDSSSPLCSTCAAANEVADEDDAKFRPPPPPPQCTGNGCGGGGGGGGGAGGGGGGAGAAGSQDPNDKVGPVGVGSANHILPGATLPYRIDFENDASASAPAQLVTVSDQLSPSFDWSSFRLTEIGFGDRMIFVPANVQHFETNVIMTYGGQTFEVQIEAGLRGDSGKVYATFRSINPSTSLPPPVNIGFLPPEDGTERGMGHFSYVINAKSNLPTGTEIRNIALIEFDLQEEIATNQREPHNPAAGTDPEKEALVTIDADGPISSVVSLPTTVTTPDFTVSRSGTDVGSGIASFDILVSTNDGPFGVWLSGTTDTSATFTGQNGSSYRFYSIARDHAGQLQPTPGATTTSTTVSVAGDAAVAINANRVPGSSTTHVVLTYPLTVGFNHVIEYRDNVNSGPDWQPLPAGPHNSGTAADDSSTGERYYRLKRTIIP